MNINTVCRHLNFDFNFLRIKVRLGWFYERRKASLDNCINIFQDIAFSIYK